MPLPLSRRGFVVLKRVQAAAGLCLATFVFVHAGNAAAGAGGAEVQARYLLAIRTGLGHPAVEVLWIGGPLAVHAGALVVVLLHERALRQQARRALAAKGIASPPRFGPRAPTARLHRLTGFALLILVPLHALALRFGALDLEGSGYARAADLVRRAPWLGRAWLGALALAAGYHVGYGLWMALVNLGVLGPGRGRQLGWVLGMLAGAAIASAALVGIAAL